VIPYLSEFGPGCPFSAEASLKHELSRWVLEDSREIGVLNLRVNIDITVVFLVHDGRNFGEGRGKDTKIRQDRHPV
jgi:hypothetical protein